MKPFWFILGALAVLFLIRRAGPRPWLIKDPTDYGGEGLSSGSGGTTLRTISGGGGGGGGLSGGGGGKAGGGGTTAS